METTQQLGALRAVPRSEPDDTVRLLLADAAECLGVSEWRLRRRILAGMLRAEVAGDQVWVLVPHSMFPSPDGEDLPDPVDERSWPTITLLGPLEPAASDVPPPERDVMPEDGVERPLDLSGLPARVSAEFHRALAIRDQTIEALRRQLAEAERAAGLQRARHSELPAGAANVWIERSAALLRQTPLLPLGRAAVVNVYRALEWLVPEESIEPDDDGGIYSLRRETPMD